MNRLCKIITYPFKLVLLVPIWIYKFCISPLLPHVCRFTPSCSTYAVQAIKNFGVFKGSALAFRRILKCTPNSKHFGFDPVPLNIKGELKWLI